MIFLVDLWSAVSITLIVFGNEKVVKSIGLIDISSTPSSNESISLPYLIKLYTFNDSKGFPLESNKHWFSVAPLHLHIFHHKKKNKY